jgi:hypothetical protein
MCRARICIYCGWNKVGEGKVGEDDDLKKGLGTLVLLYVGGPGGGEQGDKSGGGAFHGVLRESSHVGFGEELLATARVR